jgi:hypothetical protein
MDGMLDRVMRAARLDNRLFQEVEADPSLNQEALTVVVLVSAISGIGAFLSGLIGGRIGAAFLGLFVTVLLGVVNYYIWSYVTYFIGTNLFNGTAEPGELLRVLGYASGPRALAGLRFIPCLGGIIALAGSVWALVAGFIGVREALDLETTETLVTVVIGWIVIFFLNLIVGSVLGLGAMGLGAAANLLR